MKFMYIGEFPPQGFIEMFGTQFYPEQEAEVTDETAIRKLKAHMFFVHNEESAEPAVEEPPKRRGRPPRVTNAQD